MMTGLCRRSVALVAGALLTVLMAPVVSQAAAKRTVTADAVEQPPTIDGRLNEACWRSGEWSADFTALLPDHPAAKAETKFKVRLGAHKLYLGAVLDRPTGGELVSNVSERDGAVWKDDELELFIDPVPDDDAYSHVAVNAAGTVYDARRTGGGSSGYTRINIPLEVATRKASNRWTVELALPLGYLNIGGAKADQWAINVARSSWDTGERRVSSFVALAGGLHDPDMFAPLEVSADSTAAYRFNAELPDNRRLFPHDGKLVLESDVAVVNHTDAYRFFEVRAKLTRGGKTLGQWNGERGLDSGADRSFTVGVPFTMAQGKDDAKLSVVVAGREHGRVLAAADQSVALDYTPISLTLSQPAYRNNIYATQDIDALKGVLNIRLSAQDLKARTATLSLLSKQDNVIAQAKLSSLKPSMRFTLELPDHFAEGTYHLNVNLPAAHGEPAYKVSLRVRKLPPPPGSAAEVRITGEGQPLVDGEPFLPFGFMSVKPYDDLPYVARQGHNTVHAYNFYWWDEKQQTEWLNRLHRLDLKAVIFPFPKPEMRRGEASKKLLTDAQKQEIRAFVNKWKHHPAVLAWYLADEPGHKNTPPQRLKTVHEICSEVDPYHPTIILNMRTRDIKTYGPHCDILMPDPYPRFVKGGLNQRAIDYVHQFTAAANRAGRANQATWLTPQAFSYGDMPKYDRANNRAPNFIELRNMTYQGVIDETTGWIFYSYNHGRPYPGIRYGLGFVACEVQRLKPAITAVDTNLRLKAEPGEDKLLATHRTVDDHHYVFAINVDNKPIDQATIQLPEDAPSQWYVVSEDRQVQTRGQMLRDSFETFATHIYTTDPSLAGGQTVAAMQALVDKGKVIGDSDSKTPAAEVDADLQLRAGR